MRHTSCKRNYTLLFFLHLRGTNHIAGSRLFIGKQEVTPKNKTKKKKRKQKKKKKKKKRQANRETKENKRDKKGKMLLLFNKVGKGWVLDKGRKVITEVPSVFFLYF